MIVAAEALEELVVLSSGAAPLVEGTLTYIHMPKLSLPDGQDAEALLCLSGRDGYATRLFLSRQIPGKGNNWTVHRILDKQWHTWSWGYVPADLRPIEVLMCHLSALR